MNLYMYICDIVSWGCYLSSPYGNIIPYCAYILQKLWLVLAIPKFWATMINGTIGIHSIRERTIADWIVQFIDNVKLPAQTIKYHKFITKLQPKIISSQVIKQVNNLTSQVQNKITTGIICLKMKSKLVQWPLQYLLLYHPQTTRPLSWVHQEKE